MNQKMCQVKALSLGRGSGKVRQWPLKVLLATALSCLCTISSQADGDERIFWDGRINGEPVRFAFDTGTGAPFILYSGTAKRLKLQVTEPPADATAAPGQVRIGWTTSQKVDVGGVSLDSTLAVADMPEYVKTTEDGLMGWPALKNNLFLIDCVHHSINIFTNASEKFEGWTACAIDTNSDSLTLALPVENHSTVLLALDSGSANGVKLSPERWQAWRSAHTNQPMTMDSYYTPNPGFVVSEEGWTDKIALYSLRLTDVPVTVANSSDVALHSSSPAEYVATLGFAAMKRMDIVIDGKKNVVWLRPKNTPPESYRHNRLGAAFVPESMQGEDLIAHVFDGSPAFEAGIRNGDILLKIGDRDVTNWRSPNVKINTTFFDLPAGTKIELTLKRNGKIFKTTATLKNILPPDLLVTQH